MKHTSFQKFAGALLCLLLIASLFALPKRAEAAATHPGTYITDTDNENNAGTGEPDGDLDYFMVRRNSHHPIEANIFIPEGMLPTESCRTAVRTFDVD